jgi:phenylpropionate dioxygenase-like ring-hydroxylating dioxygenase large terminal subunit
MNAREPEGLSRYDFFIPASDYTDPEVGRRERERLWPKVWQVACREEEIPNVGDYVKYDIVGESIIVVRVAGDRIDAYYNVCQHRGRQLVDEPRGNIAGGFFCNFHGWSYKLDGTLRHVQWRSDWPENCPIFSDGSLDLKRPRVEQWAGWLWVCMDPDAPSLEEYLGEAPALLGCYRVEDMRFKWFETLVVDVNWKVVVEAFNEGYHVSTAHRETFDWSQIRQTGTARGIHASFASAKGASARYKDEEGRWAATEGLADQLYHNGLALHTDFNANYSDAAIRAFERLRLEFPGDAAPSLVMPRMLALYQEELESAGAVWPPELTLDAIAKAGVDWHIFPNTVLLPCPDALVWYRMRPHPDDDQKCVFDIWCLCRFAPGLEPEVKQHISNSLEEFKGRNRFLEQDFANLRATQRGMRSRGWKGAVSNPVQELSVSHFHRMLHDYIDD